MRVPSDAFMALDTPTAPVGRRFVASHLRKGHMALRHEPKARSAALDLEWILSEGGKRKRRARIESVDVATSPAPARL